MDVNEYKTINNGDLIMQHIRYNGYTINIRRIILIRYGGPFLCGCDNGGYPKIAIYNGETDD
jgi:hypothetical protein